MTQTQAVNWFTSSRLSFITLVLNILCIVYIAVIKDNTTANKVQEHSAMLIDIKSSIKDLNDRKADKEMIDRLYLQGAETRLDIKDLRLLLMQHINK